MLRDGLYQVSYRTPGQPFRGCDLFLASVRDGSILGSDRHGGMYLGRDFTPGYDGTDLIHMTCQIPPGGELVTGYTGGESGSSIAISGVLDPTVSLQKILVDVGGEPVEIEISYFGPLPEDA